MGGGGRHWALHGVPYSGVVDINAGGLRRGRRGRLINLCSHTGMGDIRYLENGPKEIDMTLVKLSHLEDCGW